MPKKKKFPDRPPSEKMDIALDKDTGDNLQEDFSSLVWMLKTMPDRQPPTDLVDEILQAVKEKKMSRRQRLLQWLSKPRSITVSPIRLIPAAAALFAALLLTFYFYSGSRGPMAIDGGKQQLVPVVFAFHYPRAHTVSLIGTFNQWNPNGFKMNAKPQEGVWTIEVHLPVGRYEYAFLVDGKVVVPDPKAQFYQRDGFGNKNSILFATKNGNQAI
ncbi:MAG: isoamylase early set domain-containing protein [Deltaproteobacteria bacterium]|nr:isoamylase early set domain-containing protein [Deltaproteobacteria bacterium]